MADAGLTPAQSAAIAQHIAILRGLYGDLGDAIDKPALRGELWSKIRAEQALLAALIRSVADPPDRTLEE